MQHSQAPRWGLAVLQTFQIQQAVQAAPQFGQWAREAPWVPPLIQ